MSPRIFIRSLAPAVAGLLILGACSASPAATTSTTDEAAPASEAAPPAADATVVAADSDLGQILTDADGMTIYFFANDTAGVSNCAGECLANWPIVTVDGEPSAGDGVTAVLGTITAADGSSQLTVNEFPAYYFVGDAAAGDTNGQGVSDVWWVFGTDGEPIEE